MFLFNFLILFYLPKIILANLAQSQFPEEGTRLTLECPVQIKTGQRQQFRWYRNGQPLDRHSPTFSIPSISRIDSGIYRCFGFTNEFGGVFSPAVNISVQYLDGCMDAKQLERHQKFVPNISFWLKAPHLNAGGNFSKFFWKWSKDGTELYSDGIRHFVNEKGDLLILDPKEETSGQYSVQITDGKKTFICGIYRVEKVLNILPSNRITTFGIIQRPEDVKTFGHNEAIHFDCVPNWGTKYEIEIKWSINSEELPETESFLRMEMGRRRLTIFNLEGLLGKWTRSAVVSCKTKGITEDGQQFGDEADARLDILEIPRINRELMEEEIVKEEGEMLSIICRADRGGWPRPKISWFFNDQMIEGANSDQLIISKLNGQKFGVYQCEMANLAGSDLMSIWVRKKRNNENGLLENFNQNPKSPKNKLIEEGPTNQSILIGSNVQMNCRIGNTLFRPIWFINNERLLDKGDISRRISLDEGGTRLRISQVGPENIGEYRCIAHRQNGMNGEAEEGESQSGLLSIIEKPGMVQNVRAELVNERSNTAENGNGGGQERIRVNWTQGFDGNSPVIKWVLEMRIMGPKGIWSDWEESMEMFPGGERPSADCCSTFVENVRPAATAQFRVLAHNRFGAGKPSLPSQQITMPQQPPTAAPSNVRASARSAQSILVQWQPPSEAEEGGEEGSNIRGYLVRYRLSGYSTADWNERRIGDGKARRELIEPLITWREYDIQVAAFNDRGLGVFSRPVTISTLEGVPMQSPQNVQILVLNSTAILVTFDPPNPQMVPGVNLGYKIQLWRRNPQGNGQQLFLTEQILPKMGRLQKEIVNLAKFTQYNATVLCFTAAGDGPSSEPVEFRTAEDLPGPVEALEIVEVFSESAIIKWELPKEANGEIQKYALEWWELNNYVEGKNIGRMEISGHSQNQTLEGLEAQTKYKISIQAFTRVGPGSKVEASFESGVPPELPERPSGLSISEVIARKVRLHFIPGSDGHARIKKWIVEAIIGHSSIFTPFAECSSLPRGTNSILIESLSPNTKYQLRLIAENVRGRSLPSEPTATFQTQQAAPEHSPHRLLADPISGGQISVIWTPLLDGEWNGDEPRAYLLQYRGFSLAHPINGGNGTLETAFNRLKWEEIRIVGAKQHQHLLSGLCPFSHYELRILAVNGVGQSEVNNVVKVWTYEAIPSAAPQFVHSELTNKGGIMAEWNELEPEMTNGQIIGFKVTLAEQNEVMGDASTILAEMEMPATHRRVQFPQTLLRPNTAYSLMVQAETIIGPGPKQELTKMLRTPEDVPDPPSNASFIYKSLSELQLGWSHPQRPKGRILHYGVLYWPLAEHRPAILFTEIPSNLVKFSATHLRPNSAYAFALKAQSSAGWGAERVFTVKTNTQSIPLPVPPVPIRDTSKPQSATELHLIWVISDVNADYSPPRSIKLQWQMANEDGWNGLVEYISATTKNYTLTRLRPNSAYRVRISFIGDLAHSVWSSPSDWLRTMEAAPFHAPSNVQLEPFDSNKLRIRCKSVPKEKWNADRIGYRVQYRIYQPPSAALPSNSTFAIEELPLAEHFPENIQIELNGLQSFRHYLVQIHAFNVLGQSPPSRPPQFILIGHMKPTKRVHNLRTDSLSSTSIRVYWDALEGNSPDSDENVNNGGYRIRWTQIMENNDAGDGVEELTMTEANEHILTDLRKWSQYRIAVSGFNRAGEGPLATVIGRTLEDLPGPVGQFQFRDILLDSVKVWWTPPTEMNGNLTGYVLLYRTSRQRNGERPLHLEKMFPKKEVQLRTGDTELVLNELEENVTYFVSVKAETAAGLGSERSAEVTIGANAGGPEAPGRPQLIPEHREVKIRWQQNEPDGNGPIIGYLVQAKRIGTALVDEEKSRNKRQMDQSTEGRKWPRHLIGYWNTIGLTNSNTENEWRIPYRELVPSSYYVFRVFARNELGIGWSSADSEQFHVPASIPDEPFYTEWWFLALVGAILAFTILGFVALLFLAGNRKEAVNAVEMIGQKKKRCKKERRGKEAAAFDTLQLSDGGIVSYELYTKRSERGDEMLFSRPNTKQSWVGSIRNSPAISSNRSNPGAICGIYGSIDGDTGRNENGKAQMQVAQLPNVYSALCTDSIAILAQNDGNGRESAQNGDSGEHSTIYSPPYYQLRQFNTNTNNNNGIYYERGLKEDGGLPLMMGPIGGEQMDGGGENLVSHYQHQQSGRRTTWRKTREKAQRDQWQKQQQQGIPLSGNIAVIRSRTPTTLFRPDENCWMAQRRSRSSEPTPELSIGEHEQHEAEMKTDFVGIPTSFSALTFQTQNNGQLGNSQSQRSSNEFAGLSSFV